MALLKPDKIYTEHGLEISEKLITASSGVRYYSGRKLATPDHKPQWITIHNTDDINEAAGTNDAEQYARATFNNNMGSVVVHYYIDETACWHILADDTVGWHAADGSNGPGNTTSVAIEIIMDGSGKEYDVKAEDRGALLAAILLNKYGLGMDRLTTHKRWYPSKYCPAYILPHWTQFYNKVKTYYEQIKGEKQPEKKPAASKNYLTYPTKNMNITQGITGDSHTRHSAGSPADYPIDDGCSDEGRDWFYCPCDELRVAHIYGVWNGKKTNTIWLESNSKVVMPCGEDYVTIHVVHPNDDTLGGLKVGQTFKRGERMFLEGNDGNADGYHFHIAVGTGKFVAPGWVLNSKGSWVHNTTGRQLRPEEAFFVDPAFTSIIKTKGIEFKTLPQEDRQATLYFVQIGSFGKKGNAEAYAATARKAGFTTMIKEADVGGKRLYRVQIGAFGKKENAESYAAEARKKGFDAVIM